MIPPGSLKLGVPRVTVASGACEFFNVDIDGEWYGEPL